MPWKRLKTNVKLCIVENLRFSELCNVEAWNSFRVTKNSGIFMMLTIGHSPIIVLAVFDRVFVTITLKGCSKKVFRWFCYLYFIKPNSTIAFTPSGWVVVVFGPCITKHSAENMRRIEVIGIIANWFWCQKWTLLKRYLQEKFSNNFDVFLRPWLAALES